MLKLLDKFLPLSGYKTAITFGLMAGLKAINAWLIAKGSAEVIPDSVVDSVAGALLGLFVAMKTARAE